MYEKFERALELGKTIGKIVEAKMWCGFVDIIVEDENGKSFNITIREESK